jgi:hypothetical protein
MINRPLLLLRIPVLLNLYIHLIPMPGYLLLIQLKEIFTIFMKQILKRLKIYSKQYQEKYHLPLIFGHPLQINPFYL